MRPCDVGASWPLRGSWEQLNKTEWPEVVRGYQSCPFLLNDYHDDNQRRSPFKMFTPDGCTLDQLTRESLMSAYANRTVVLVGDSISRNQFYSLACSIGCTSYVRARVRIHGHRSLSEDGQMQHANFQCNQVRFSLCPHSHVCAVNDEIGLLLCYLLWSPLKLSIPTAAYSQRTLPELLQGLLHGPALRSPRDVLMVNLIEGETDRNVPKTFTKFASQWPRHRARLLWRETVPQGWRGGIFPGFEAAKRAPNCNFTVENAIDALNSSTNAQKTWKTIPALRDGGYRILPAWTIFASTAQIYHRPPADCTHFAQPSYAYHTLNRLLTHEVVHGQSGKVHEQLDSWQSRRRAVLSMLVSSVEPVDDGDNDKRNGTVLVAEQRWPQHASEVTNVLWACESDSGPRRNTTPWMGSGCAELNTPGNEVQLGLFPADPALRKKEKCLLLNTPSCDPEFAY